MLSHWLPTRAQMWDDLGYVPPAAADVTPPHTYEGTPLAFFIAEKQAFFNGNTWSRNTALHWEIPLVAVSVYLVTIPLLRAHVTKVGKYNTRSFALVWNIGLSIFSMVGLAACAPVMLSSLLSSGPDFTICANASWYGHGWHGLWVAFFIYSKFLELVDTVLLLLSARPVILIHWWHHLTVLLYCWHSYATRSAAGLWYASMNYGVHSVMYAYFGATQYSKHVREYCKPYAMYITLLQLAQMVAGIAVTARAMAVQAAGRECNVNKTNSILGLLMYFSYFVLFLKLFLDNYVLKAKKTK